MAIVNRFADFHDEITGWRRDLHQHPELLYDVERTAGVVSDKLKSFGVDKVLTGYGRTGIVGVIKGKSDTSGKVIGLRADMDALPIHEATGKDYASRSDGKMHACGHDGHTAMLLGAAKYLSETRNFDGTAVVIFQPAEEGGAGGKMMVDDGMMDDLAIDEVYGLHNYPGMAVGEFALRPGPLMAAADFFDIEIEGKGGHAARPSQCVDPVVVGSAIVQALQSIASRSVDPLDSVVVSVTQFHAGDANNVIPQTATLSGTARTLKSEVADIVEARMHEVVESVARAHGAKARLNYIRLYPVTSNHDAQTGFAAGVARTVAGSENVDDDITPVMGGEDFSFMLNARPGAFMFLGNGDSAGLHHPEYDFNDEIIPIGCSYWVKLVETALPA